MDLSGVFVPTATAYDAAGDLDLEAFRANVRSWLSHAVSGLVVGGSTGEAVLLDTDERAALWRISREELGERLLIAGTGTESTRSAIAMAKLAAECGADGLLVQPPAFFKGAMSESALTKHFTELADASPVPVILYQVPLKFSTLDFDNGWVAKMSAHPNIVGIKDSRGKLDLVVDLVQRCEPGFQVMVGNGAILLDSLRAGAVGGILGIANILTADCVEIGRAHRAGEAAAADEAQARVAPAHIGIVGGMGVPGVKFALDQIGLAGGLPRPPLHPLPEGRRDECRDLLAAAGAALVSA